MVRRAVFLLGPLRLSGVRASSLLPNVGLSCQRKTGPIFTAFRPLPQAQTFTSHGVEPSCLVVLAAPLDGTVCTVPLVATPLWWVFHYNAQPWGVVHVWWCRARAGAPMLATPVQPLEGRDMSPRNVPCPLVLMLVRPAVQAGLVCVCVAGRIQYCGLVLLWSALRLSRV